MKFADWFDYRIFVWVLPYWPPLAPPAMNFPAFIKLVVVFLFFLFDKRFWVTRLGGDNAILE